MPVVVTGFDRSRDRSVGAAGLNPGGAVIGPEQFGAVLQVEAPVAARNALATGHAAERFRRAT
jgi:hypothetical protein